MYHISYEKNNICQSILIDVDSTEEARRVFRDAMPDATIYGCHVARPDDIKLSKPVISTR